MAQDLTTPQITARDADFKHISWLFHVVDANDVHYHWSTKTVPSTASVTSTLFSPGFVYESRTYFTDTDDDHREFTFKITDFDGITLGKTAAEQNMVMPSDVKFGVLNSDGALTAGDFIGGQVLISVRVDGDGESQVLRRWRFDIKSAYEFDNIIRIVGQSFIEKFIRGKYPNTKQVRGIDGFQTDGARSRWEIARDDSEPVVPITWGTAYIPCMLVNSNADSEEAYLIGPLDVSNVNIFNITEVSTPTGFGDSRSTWSSGSFTMGGIAITDTEGQVYLAAQPILLDTNNDGTNDAMGLWMVGDTSLPVNFKFTNSDTININTPASMAWWVLQSYGVPGKFLNDNSFEIAAQFYTNNSGTTGGGLWTRVDRGKFLNNILQHGNATLLVDDGLEFLIKSKASQTTITKADVLKRAPEGPTSFRREQVDYTEFLNGGWFYSRHTDKAQDDPHLSGVAGTTELASDERHYSPEILDLRFFTHDPATALTGATRAATLYYERKQNRESEIEFITNGKHCDLNPEDVITISDADYGGTYTAVIDEMEFHRDLSITIRATKYRVTLRDWSDIAAPGVETNNSLTKTNAVQLVFAGPQSAAPSSGQMPNALPNRLRIGEANSYVLMDQDNTLGPSVRIFKSGTELVRLGELNSFGNYAAASEFGFSVFIDATNFINIDPTDGMQISSNKSAAITIEEGGDIILKSGAADGGLLRLVDHASAYGEIRWEQSGDSTKYWTMHKTVTNDTLYIGPSAALEADNPIMHLGISSLGDFADQMFFEATSAYRFDVNNESRFEMSNSNDTYFNNTQWVQIQAKSSVDARLILIANAAAANDDYADLISTDAGLFSIRNRPAGSYIERITVDQTGNVFINDSANTFSTIGLTINQSTNDDEIFTLKSSTDVNHSVTGAGGTEADTFGYMKKIDGTGGGLLITGHNDADNDAALEFAGIHGQNNPSDNNAAIKIEGKKYDAGTSVTNLAAAETVLRVLNNGTLLNTWFGSGAVQIGTDQVKNANQTIGLTINQAGNDDEILAFKSSDVAHGITNITEADTFCLMDKTSATGGGLDIQGFSDVGTVSGITLKGNIGATNPTDTTAAIRLVSFKDSGASGQAALGDDETVLQVVNGATNLVTILGDGDVGIGTVSPSSKLEVNGGITEVGGVLKQNLLTNSGFGVWSNSTLENVGSDLTVNGDFDLGDQDWTKGTGWTIADQGGGDYEAVCTNGTLNERVSQVYASAIVGKLYKISATCTNYTDGSWAIYCDHITGNFGAASTAAETITLTFEAIATSITFGVACQTTGADFRVDNITMFEVTPGCVAANGLGPDGWSKNSSASTQLFRQHNDGGTLTQDGEFYSLKIVDTVGSANTALLWPNGRTINTDHTQRFAGRVVTLGAWVKAAAASDVYLRIYDGSSTDSAANSGTGWEWLEVTATISASASEVFFGIRSDGAATGTYVSQPIATFGSSIGQGNYVPSQDKWIPLEAAVNIRDTNRPLAADDKTLNVEALSNGKIPKGTAVLFATVTAKASAVETGGGINFGSGSGEVRMRTNPQVVNHAVYNSGEIICDSNGDIYQQVSQSGDTFTDHDLLVTSVKVR